jgi:disulfide bond formation protein DsbB
MNVRIANALGALACTGLMAYALYVQYGLGLEPCPLCVLQRIAVITLGGIFLVAALHPAGAIGRRVYAVLLGFVALVGSGVAGRHVWLTMLPPERVPACGPGLDFMLESFPFREVLSMVLTGSGECAKVEWRLLGLSMPAWVLIALLGLGVFGVACNWRKRQPSRRSRISR